MKADGSEYTQGPIEIMDEREHVRARSPMYIGAVDECAYQHLALAFLELSLEEAWEGHCTAIDMVIHEDGSLSIEDNGRGLSVRYHPGYRVPFVEAVLAKSLGQRWLSCSCVHMGVHGLEPTVVNYLSDWLEVEVYREGKIHWQRYTQGRPEAPLKVLGETKKRGTYIRFLPDPSIFKDVAGFQWPFLAQRLRDLAALNPGLKLTLTDLREGRERELVALSKNGLVDILAAQLGTDPGLFDTPLCFSGDVHSEACGGLVKITGALQLRSQAEPEDLRCFANCVPIEKGTHVQGFRQAMAYAFSERAFSEQAFKKAVPGLVAVVAAQLPRPVFVEACRNTLGNPELRQITREIVRGGVECWRVERPGAVSALESHLARLDL